MNAVFEDIYEWLKQTLLESDVFGGGQDLVKPSGLIEYSDNDGSKRQYSASDYPRLEILPVEVASDGNTSNAWRYILTFRVTLATGSMILGKRAIPLMQKLLLVADRLLPWRRSWDDGSLAMGHSHGSVTFGQYAPERGDDTVDGWAFQFNISFHVIIKQQ